MPGLSGPQVTKGLYDTKGLRVTFKPREKKNMWLGATVFLIGVGMMVFRYLWETKPIMRDYQLSHLVRDFIASLEMIRLFLMFRSQAVTTIPTIKDSINNEISLINGASMADLLNQQGYAHAKDRIFQMDFLRTMAVGNLTAKLGPNFAKTDIFVRPFGLRAVAAGDCSALSEEDRGYASAYAEGVNSYLRSASLSPIEYRSGSWLAMSWEGSIDEWACEDTFLVLRLAALRWSHGWEAALIDSALGKGEVRKGQSSNEAFSNAFSRDVEPDFDDTLLQFVPAVGAVAWAVTGYKANENIGEKSADSRPGALLYNEIFGGAKRTSMEEAWYVNRLQISSPALTFDVTGYSLPGVPFVMIGHNSFASWGVTLSTEPANRLERVRFQRADCTESTSIFNCGPDEREKTMCGDSYFLDDKNENENEIDALNAADNVPTCSDSERSSCSVFRPPSPATIKVEIFSNANDVRFSKRKNSEKNAKNSSEPISPDVLVAYAVSQSGGVYIPATSLRNPVFAALQQRRGRQNGNDNIYSSSSSSSSDSRDAGDDGRESMCSERGSISAHLLHSSAVSAGLNLKFLHDVNKANSVDSFRSAVKTADALFLNWIYADVGGNIASFRSGKIKAEKVEVDVQRGIKIGDADVVNPKSGVIVSGDIVLKKNLLNAKAIPKLDEFLSRLQSKNSKISRAEVLELVQDTQSPFSHDLAAIISSLNISAIGGRGSRKSVDLSELQACQDAVGAAKYDGSAHVGSSGQLVVEAFKNELVNAMIDRNGLHGLVTILGGYEYLPLTSFPAHKWFHSSTWLLDAIDTARSSSSSTSSSPTSFSSVSSEGIDTFLRSSFAHACRHVHSEHGTSSTWRWGYAHAAVFPSNVASSNFGNRIFTAGPIEMGGCGDCLSRSDSTSSISGAAPQLRMFVDLNHRDADGNTKIDSLFDVRLGKSSFRLDSYDHYLRTKTVKKMV